MQQIKSHKSSQPKGQNSLFRKARKRKRSSVEMVTAVHPLVRLQQTIGNQAVGRLIQTQLKVGKPGDKYEREADRVADTVMQMPDPQVQQQAEEEKEIRQQPAEEKKEEKLQRQPEPEEKEELQRQPQEEKKEELRKQPAEEKKEELRAQPAEKEEELKKLPEDEKKEETVASKEMSGHTPTVTPKIQANIQNMRGSGKPLPSSVGNFFEPRFGCDFSQVRVHHDTKAAETAQGVKAKAFTVGRDVVFGEGQYDTGTSKGRKLLAHKLIHVVQQKQITQRLNNQNAFSIQPRPKILQNQGLFNQSSKMINKASPEDVSEHVEELKESEEFQIAWNQTLAEMIERYPEMSKQLPKYQAHFKDAFHNLGGREGLARLRVALEVALELGEKPEVVLALWRQEGDLKLSPLLPYRLRIRLHRSNASFNEGRILPGERIKKGVRSYVLNNYMYWNTGSDVFTLFKYDRQIKDNVLVTGFTENIYNQRRSKFITSFIEMEKKIGDINDDNEFRKQAISTWNMMMSYVAYHEESIPGNRDWVIVTGEVANPEGLMKILLKLAVKYYKAGSKIQGVKGAEIPLAMAYWKYNTGEINFLHNIDSVLMDIKYQWLIHLSQMPVCSKSPTLENQLECEQKNDQWKYDHEHVKSWEERIKSFSPLIDEYLANWKDWVNAIKYLEKSNIKENQRLWALEQVKAKNEWFAAFNFNLLFEWIRSSSPEDTKSPLWEDKRNRVSRANMLRFYFILEAYKKFFESVPSVHPTTTD